MIQVHYIYCTLFLLLLHCDNVVMGAMGAAVNIDEASLAHPPLTSSCETQFLTGHRPISWGAGGW